MVIHVVICKDQKHDLMYPECAFLDPLNAQQWCNELNAHPVEVHQQRTYAPIQLEVLDSTS